MSRKTTNIWYEGNEFAGAFKIDWKENSTKPKEFKMVTIQVPEGSFIATKNESKEQSAKRFSEWLKD